MTPEAAARRRLASDLDVVAYLRTLPPALRDRALAALGDENVRALDGAWPVWAHDGQLPPAAQADGAPWSTWVIKAGRGFGKTLAGAQWVTAAIAGGERLNIALVGASLDDARRVMVEGRSGLLQVAAPWVRDWQPSFRRLRFITGAEADAAALHGTTEVVAEGNQGGKMVAAVLLTADAGLRVRLVTATVGKTARAEPVAMMFEAGKAHLHGRMPELEAQLLGMIAGGEYEGPGASPDRADAMVWGLGEVTRGRVEARVRGF